MWPINVSVSVSTVLRAGRNLKIPTEYLPAPDAEETCIVENGRYQGINFVKITVVRRQAVTSTEKDEAS